MLVDEKLSWQQAAGNLVRIGRRFVRKASTARSGTNGTGCMEDARRTSAAAAGGRRGRKRVRRMQLELPLERQQVRELELKLRRLQLQRAAGVKAEAEAPDSPWNALAERQLKERLRAERRRRQLRERHAELADMCAELRKLLRKSGEQQQEVAARVQPARQRFWDYDADPADEIFAHQLAVVAAVRLQMQRQSAPLRTLHLGSGLSMSHEMVRRDPKTAAGVVLEARCGTTLPFTLDVAADAYWRFFGCGYGLERTVRHEANLATGVISRSFTIRTDFEGFTSKVGGKYTARRYVDEDGTVTIVWAGGGDLHEIGGVNFDGTQLHKRGVIKLRRVPRQGPGLLSTSTVVEASFETTPMFHERVANKARQTQTLLDALNSSYSKVDKLFCMRMGKLLVEEDWKATFGREA